MRTLREWRVNRLLSLRDLGEMAGVTPKTVLDLEKGRRQPTFATIRKVAGALQVDPVEVAEFARVLRQRERPSTIKDRDARATDDSTAR